MDTLVRIKRLVIARNVLFTRKAESEMAVESLTPEMVYESILVTTQEPEFRSQ